MGEADLAGRVSQALKKTELGIFVERAAADELLAELRRPHWKTLRPELLLEPPSFSSPGGVAFERPSYMTAYLEVNVHLANPMLEMALLKTDYEDGLAEIESLGLAEKWDAFFKTKQQLYRLEVRSKKFTTVQTAVVTQNRETGKPERDAMNCIWSRCVVRDYVGEVCLL